MVVPELLAAAKSHVRLPCYNRQSWRQLHRALPAFHAQGAQCMHMHRRHALPQACIHMTATPCSSAAELEAVCGHALLDGMHCGLCLPTGNILPKGSLDPASMQILCFQRTHSCNAPRSPCRHCSCCCVHGTHTEEPYDLAASSSRQVHAVTPTRARIHALDASEALSHSILVHLSMSLSARHICCLENCAVWRLHNDIKLASGLP